MTEKIILPQFRISRAAMGRRLATAIFKIQEAGLSPEAYAATMNAVLNSCLSEGSMTAPSADVDQDILASEQAEIEKSERRSAAARKAAEKRRLQRENSEQGKEMIEKEIKEDIEVAEPIGVETEPTEVAEAVENKKRRRKRRRRRKKAHLSGTERDAMNPDMTPITTTTATVTSMSVTSSLHG